MSQIDLQALEKKAFRTVFDDGLWDLFIALALFLFTVAPILAGRFGLGDFWSSVIFLPFYLLAFWLFRIAKTGITIPRLGMMKIGAGRRSKIRGLQWILAVVLVLGLLFGVAVTVFGATLRSMNWMFTAVVCFVFMFSFTTAAVMLDVRRFIYYGLLIVMLVCGGEILFWRGFVTHHGIPQAFGLAAAVIGLTGLILLIRFRRKYPRTTEDIHDNA